MDSNRRLTEKLLRYWLQLRGEKPFPPESAIDRNILADIWESCFLVKLGASANSYTHLGKNLIEAFGGDMTKADTALFLASPFTAYIEENFTEAVKTHKPVTDEGLEPNSHKAMIKYRVVLLPLGDKKITHILGAMRWQKSL